MMRTAALLLLLAEHATAAFAPSATQLLVTRDHTARIGSARMNLQPFLEKAGVAPKFMQAVIEALDEEMIGTEEALRTASAIGLLRKTLKPVIYLGIEKALGMKVDVSQAAAELSGVMANAKPTVTVPTELLEVRIPSPRTARSACAAQSARDVGVEFCAAPCLV